MPSYVTMAVDNAATYTWATDTNDSRALQLPNNGGGLAAAWYSNHFSVPPTFTFDVNLTDGQQHQVALYALDWDNQGRAETVQIQDATTLAQLDIRNVSGFSAGTYLVWNISGHVLINVTETVGPNCVMSGIFFQSTSGGTVKVTLSPSSAILGGNQQQQFVANVTGTPSANLSWAINPSGVGTISQTGLYEAPATFTNGQQVTLTATQQGTSSSGSATVTLTTSAAVNFVATDTSTQGSWEGIYGADGYVMANVVPADPPSYATFTEQNTTAYTWVPNTGDPRALQIPGGTGGIAATWFSSPSESFTVNITDSKVHQVALYALDWDDQGRAEMVQIVDANTNNVLDTRTISNFSNGTYLVWNISGDVIVNVTATGGPNAVVSGFFFGGGSSAGITVSPSTVTLGATQTQQFAAIVSGPNKSVTWSLSGGGSISSTGLYQAPSTITSAQTVTVTATGASATGTATVNLTPSATAVYDGLDTSTQGNWSSKYGAAGYSLANSVQSLPANVVFTVLGTNGTWTWATDVSDSRALLVPGGGNIAACWYKNHESFELDVNFTDAQTHQISVYAVDWDAQGRTESVAILDGTSGNVLNTEEVSNFSNGVYLTWTVTGHVTVNVTSNGGPNAVISGMFFQ